MVKKDNKKIYWIIGIFLAFAITNQQGTFSGSLVCQSNEPPIIDGYSDYDQKLKEIMVNSITDNQGDAVNIITIVSTLETNLECVFYCDAVGNSETSCWEHRTMAICEYRSGEWDSDILEITSWPFGLNNHSDSGSGSVTTYLKTSYKGIPYVYATERDGYPYSIQQDPNGFSLRDNNMFILFSAQLNDNIIKNYIDTFYNVIIQLC